MVKRHYRLLALVGVIFMAAGLATTYLALGQDSTPPVEVTEEVTAEPADGQPTVVPPTATLVPPTATLVPPTATLVPPTATLVPPTATLVPPTEAPTQASPTPVTPAPETTAEPVQPDSVSETITPTAVIATEVIPTTEPVSDEAAAQSNDMNMMAAAPGASAASFGRLQQLFQREDWRQIQFTLALPDGRVIPGVAGEFDPQTLTDAPPGRYVLDMMLADGQAERYEFDLQADQVQALIAVFPVMQAAAPTSTPIPPTAQPAVAAVQPTATVTLPPPTAVADAASVAAAAPAAQVSGIISGAVLNLRVVSDDGFVMDMQPDASGQFRFDQLPAGTYHLEASAPGYLSARISFGLAQGQVMAVPPTGLIAGDTNGDQSIDMQDAALIAANFGGPAQIPAADLNGDGWIDIHDLSLVGRHFGFTGPTAWGQP